MLMSAINDDKWIKKRRRRRNKKKVCSLVFDPERQEKKRQDMVKHVYLRVYLRILITPEGVYTHVASVQFQRSDAYKCLNCHQNVWIQCKTAKQSAIQCKERRNF